MNVLYLVHRIPFPPDKGDKIRSFRWLQHLCEGHDVHLVTLYDDPDDAKHLPELEGICASVHAFPLKRGLAKIRAVGGLFSRWPLSLPYFDSAEARRALQRVVAENSIDVALCFSSSMAQYLDGSNLPCRVMDMVDVDSEKFRSYAALGSGPSSWLYRIEAGRLARYEEKLVGDFDSVILCTEQEAALLRDRVDLPERVVAIGNGVVLPEADEIPAERNSKRIVFVGAMDYQANVDAVVFAANEIMPLVQDEQPDATFQIVGRDPTPEVKALASLPGVEVTGKVPDIKAYLADAALSLVPLRIAQGIQNKVLEAMAWQLPVITASRIGSSMGLDAFGPLYLADSAEDYAKAVIDLLDDPKQRRERGEDGRRFVEEHFSWQPRLAALDELLDRCRGRVEVSR